MDVGDLGDVAIGEDVGVLSDASLVVLTEVGNACVVKITVGPCSSQKVALRIVRECAQRIEYTTLPTVLSLVSCFNIVPYNCIHSSIHRSCPPQTKSDSLPTTTRRMIRSAMAAAGRVR